MRPWLLLALAAAATACDRDPMNRTDDLWPGLRRAPATAFPSSDQIAMACFQARIHFKQEAEKTPGTHVDLEDVELLVRKPQCRWEQGSASTALCRFEMESLSLGQSEAERRDSLAYLNGRDWDPHQARMVLVTSLGPGWVVPEGCNRVPEPEPAPGGGAR